ncbi:deleted in malignant brain tumors 1 protein-like isoform X1 [Pecten maximus]|uniref:deleted in malignant brain tumors 1 protein-like isoform X1 n=2 Tax=Pecten maximus TaxID=6579 RepID=UPI001458A803|nr:deleted in malignant brain tumors 1 protein-like isoform X1 [Pecten maximus]
MWNVGRHLVDLGLILVFLGLVQHSSAAEPIHVRLQGGDGTTTGRVEVSRNGTDWGTVCDDLWSDQDAQVVCRQLGHQWGTSHSNSPFGEGTGAIYLDNVQCTGSERSLADCQHNGWGVNNCRHYEDAGVSCYDKSVRLQSRGRTDVGTVEVRLDDGWVQVCDDEWGYSDAKVVCRQLGYKDAMYLRGSKLGKMSTDSLANKALTRFKCRGSEKELLNCTHAPITTKCNTMNRAAAICYNKSKSDVDMSFSVDLLNGSRHWGEVNVRKHGVWGQVCSTGTEWNDLAARVVCRERGFVDGKAYGTVNETLRPIWITQLNCSGKESSLESCVGESDSWGRPMHSCRAAYALCFNKSVSVSLAGGGSYFGRVQITYDGVTGTVCDKSWSSSDARVLCKSMKFADGEPISDSYYGKGTGPIMMSGLGCYGQEKSILQCRNHGWKVYNNSDCSDHSRDASVICYKNVRLSRGDHSYGVVKVMDQFWSVLCGEGFDNKDAMVICTQLGFLSGRALPPGSFGTFYGRYTWPNLNCTGNETKIEDCGYDRFRGCQRDNYLGYAAVSCYNGSLSVSSEMRLENSSGSSPSQSGRVGIKQYGIWGRICPTSWDDKDADVVCRSLKFRGGVAFQETPSGSGPFFMGQVNCIGNESSLFNCSIGGDECDSQYSGAAGVLCYKNTPPKLHLVGGLDNFGRLEIVMDDQRGSICDIGWSRYDATVACKQLGFRDGEYRRGLAGPPMPKFLTSMNCFGAEKSIFMCKNPGWKRGIESRCNNPNHNAGVFCYNNVRISNGESQDHATTGRVEMYNDGKWITVCADQFGKSDAKVVCKELGFPYSKPLMPGAFGSKYYLDSILQLNCTGDEQTISKCQFTEGTCPKRSYNYASVLCSKNPVENNDVKIIPAGDFPATVLVEKHGINGTICADGWTETDAMVVCRQMGYRGGAMFGSRYYSSRTPIWMSNVNCLGNETNINQCPYNETAAQKSCRSNRLAARVFCYRNSGFQLRLAGSDNQYSGRVEMAYNGEWGTICDSFWNNDNAKVVCRQFGFVDGVALSSGTFPPGTGPSWLYYVHCTGDEKAVWGCGSTGWNVTHTSCRTHRYDASVYCTGKVRLEPNITFGAVEVWQDNEYVLVCADDFDDVDAQVACRMLGYQNGISICCSVFGNMSKYKIAINNVQCNGQEASIMQCKYSYRLDVCPSGKYASVACSNTASSGEYDLRLTEGVMGAVEVRHLDVWGTICPEGFDDRDAKVLCREMNYRDGFSYYRHEFNSGPRKSLPWLSNLNCSSSEGYLARCGNLRWGDVRNCSLNTKAAVYCTSDSNVPIRLVNGSNSLSGRVEISINGEWGSVCGASYWDDKDASVLCRMLNHSSGRALNYGHYGSGSGPIWIGHMRCKGDEDSIFHCPMNFNSRYTRGENSDPFYRRSLVSRSLVIRQFGCTTHHTDAGVQCYDTVRLVDSNDVFYGRLELYANKSFRSVCDDGFTDVSATIVCRQLGYKFGRKQCCSALGQIASSNITISNVRCMGHETKLDNCNYNITECPSKNYVSIYCSAKAILPATAMQIRIDGNKYYGSLEANLYGFWGPICRKDWDDKDANVTCAQLGFSGGMSYRGTTILKTPVAVGRFDCVGNEKRLDHCQYKLLGDDLGCSSKIVFYRETAGVLCYSNKEGVSFRIKGKKNRGSVMVKYNGEWGRVCGRGWSDNDASVFCKQMKFVDGKVGKSKTEKGEGHVWMDYVSCTGNEKSLLECKVNWDPDYASCYDATVLCTDSVRLEKGDMISHGIVQVYMDKIDKWGVVCNHDWDRPANLRVTCQQLGFENGLSICCGAYGYLYSQSLAERIQCYGNETKLQDCKSDNPYGSCSVDYAAVACYNGSLSSNYSLGIQGSSKARSSNSGSVELKFLNISGRICADDWDDNDATVVCRELGYSKGIAYQHKVLFGKGNPIWASSVNCNGSEYFLKDCANFTLGQVKQCNSRKEAGILCYSNRGVNFRINGSRAAGRIEISVDGVWGTMCDRYWDKADATAFCRYFGFAAGFPYNTDKYRITTGRVYEPDMHCNGNEKSPLECAHEGWKVAESGSCWSHDKDAVVHCYNTVKLDSGVGTDVKDGPVLYYYNNTWNFICDKDFTDVSARKVCQELGFVDGRAVCCSAYITGYQEVLVNHSLTCNGDENSIEDCLKPSSCGRYDTYASVICLNQTDYDNTSIRNGDIKIKIAKTENGAVHRGQIAVHQYGKEGRIMASLWDDKEARVFCRSAGFKYGFAHPYAKSRFETVSPFFLSSFNCTGNEKSLLDCPYKSRHSMSNGTKEHMAAVVCYNDSGIKYRITGPKPGQGRVEMAFNGLWGTVCDASWDNREAAVFCRAMNFSDGYAVGNAYYGMGEGPIWISHLRCDGTEENLHTCPHQGFSEDVVTSTSDWKTCSSHKDDASVFCVDKIRLNLGANATMGAVQIYRDKKWLHICDDTFDNDDAQVVCRTLGYRDGVSVPGSSFGNVSDPIGISNVNCGGREGSFFDCSFIPTKRCQKKTYASVYCSNQSIVNTDFEVKIASDHDHSIQHGEILVKLKGIWGSVCLKDFDEREATMVCKKLGYKGGQPYLAKASKTKYPILMSKLKCIGNEASLDKCDFLRVGQKESCDYYSNKAGVLCYKAETGIQYRLNGGKDPSQGRVEIQYEGNWGGVCNFLWDTHDANVLCRSMSYRSGIEVAGGRYGRSEGPVWFTRVSCTGKEDSLFTCSHSGFNVSGKTESTYERLCRRRAHDAAAQCYNKDIDVTGIRLADGGDNYGRVEVYLTGPEQWGTVCDDYFDDKDATVICRQLGFAQGYAKKMANFGRGDGPIWMDNLGCFGNETKITDCKHNGFNVENCNHAEDASVICNGSVTSKPLVSVLSSDENLALAITIPVIVLLLLFVAGLGFFFYRQVQPRGEIKKVLVDNETMEPGSQAAASSSASASGEGQVTFSKLKARFTKAKPSIQNGSKEASATPVKGMSNPNYDNMPDYANMGDISIEHQGGGESVM